MAQFPFTLVWVVVMVTGVPFGTQTAWLSWSRTGAPRERTRVAPLAHCATTQGTGAPETVKGQPVTMWGALIVVNGRPPTRTRGLGTVGCACPPWVQSTPAPESSRKPG